MACVFLRPRKRPLFAAGVCFSTCIVVWAVATLLLRSVIAQPSAEKVVAIIDSWPKSSSEVLEVLARAYDGLDGQRLNKDDLARASELGITFQKTYGEFTSEGVDVLLETLNVSSGDVFCDLGSGAGKVVMQAYLQRRPKEAIGIELSEARHKLAEVAHSRLLTLAPAVASDPKSGPLTYVHGDVPNSDSTLSRCNKIFFCSRVWPPELLDKMVHRFISHDFQHKPVWVASSKELKAFGGIMGTNQFPGKARFVRHTRVETSWGASFISLYMLHES